MLTTVRVLSENGPIRVELARSGRHLVVTKRLVGFHPDLERRLTREAEVVRKLAHPGILPLLDVRDGALVYPYLPGLDLAEALDRGPLPPARVCAIVLQVLDALGYAHRNGIVHHDVKPSNLRLRGERAVLVDFGFAKDVALTSITANRQTLGTPHYMAPEQFAGRRADPRSDLYGLAATAYHALTGAPPYGSQALRVLVGDLPPRLAPLPEDAAPLAQWIATALAYDPEERFQSAGAMADALQSGELSAVPVAQA